MSRMSRAPCACCGSCTCQKTGGADRRAVIWHVCSTVHRRAIVDAVDSTAANCHCGRNTAALLQALPPWAWLEQFGMPLDVYRRATQEVLASHGAIEALLKALTLFLSSVPAEPQPVSEALRALHYICLLNAPCTARLVAANGFELVCKSELCAMQAAPAGAWASALLFPMDHLVATDAVVAMTGPQPKAPAPAAFTPRLHAVLAAGQPPHPAQCSVLARMF